MIAKVKREISTEKKHKAELLLGESGYIAFEK